MNNGKTFYCVHAAKFFAKRMRIFYGKFDGIVCLIGIVIAALDFEGLRIFLQYRRRSVGRTVIDADNLDVLERL